MGRCNLVFWGFHISSPRYIRKWICTGVRVSFSLYQWAPDTREFSDFLVTSFTRCAGRKCFEDTLFRFWRSRARLEVLGYLRSRMQIDELSNFAIFINFPRNKRSNFTRLPPNRFSQTSNLSRTSRGHISTRIHQSPLRTRHLPLPSPSLENRKYLEKNYRIQWRTEPPTRAPNGKCSLAFLDAAALLAHPAED